MPTAISSGGFRAPCKFALSHCSAAFPRAQHVLPLIRVSFHSDLASVEANVKSNICWDKDAFFSWFVMVHDHSVGEMIFPFVSLIYHDLSVSKLSKSRCQVELSTVDSSYNSSHALQVNDTIFGHCLGLLTYQGIDGSGSPNWGAQRRSETRPIAKVSVVAEHFLSG